MPGIDILDFVLKILEPLVKIEMEPVILNKNVLIEEDYQVETALRVLAFVAYSL